MSNSNNVSNQEASSEDRGKYWLLTINASDEDPEGLQLQRSVDDIEDLHDTDQLLYAVGQYERGDNNGRMHIQAYLIFKERKYARWISARVYRAYLCLSRAEIAHQGIKYCDDKNKQSFIRKAFEFGNKPSVTRGKRTDLEIVDEGIRSGDISTFREVNDTRVSVAARNANWAKWRLAEAAKDEYLSEERYDDDYEPYVWQYWMDRILKETRPTERRIMFVVDKLGHGGKTRFCYEFERSSGKRCQTIRAMPKRDMAAAIENRREVMFIDVPRGRHRYMDTVYVFMEEAKDGKLAMEKYNSHMLYQPRMHMVVFMNDDVDIGQNNWYPDHRGEPDNYVKSGPPLTHDRYAIWDRNQMPELFQKWRLDGPYGRVCPPFIAFDEEMECTEYIPPIVNNFGSEYSSDVTGDGPSFTRTQFGGYTDEYLNSYMYYVVISFYEWDERSVTFGRSCPYCGILCDYVCSKGIPDVVQTPLYTHERLLNDVIEWTQEDGLDSPVLRHVVP